MKYDLLSLVEDGGCSAKLNAKQLSSVLLKLPKMEHPNLLVDIETHDDAGVYKINDEVALIQTTDFFPPVCSDPYEFGQIAAANAMSDVYAMGGEVLTALNLMLFPTDLPLDILKDILQGGQDKVAEGGGVVVGGHTIADDTPKYGLALSGQVHPDHIVTNADAEVGDILILTKPIGTGTSIAAKKLGIVEEETYKMAIEQMKMLNDKGAEVMRKYGVKCATDVTGFGLMGHALKMAEGSKKSIQLNMKDVPVIKGVYELLDMGCIPDAAFRNLDFAEEKCLFETNDYSLKMLAADAQTSGGLLMCVSPDKADGVLNDLKEYHKDAAIIGNVVAKQDKALILK